MRKVLFFLTLLTLLSGLFACSFLPLDDNMSDDNDDQSTIVEEVTITSVTLKHSPLKTEYLYDEALSVEGAMLEVLMSNGEKSEVAVSLDMVEGYNPKALGEQVVKVNYEGYTLEFSVRVVDDIKEIVIKSAPAKVTYLYGESLDLTGAKIEIITLSGAVTEVEISNDMISGYNANLLGEQQVTVNYGGTNLSFDVVVVDAIDTVAVLNKPTKTTYLYGESLDLTGAKIEIITLSGVRTEVAVTADMVSGFDANKLGTQTINVVYEDKNLSFNVVVEDAISSVSFAHYPSKLDYLYGESLDLDGAILEVAYLSSAKNDVNVTASMVSGYDASKLGSQTIKVVYGDYKLEFNIEVRDVVASVQLLSAPIKNEYLPNEDLSVDGAVIREVMLSGATNDIDVTLDMVSGFKPARLGSQTIKVLYGEYEFSFAITVAENPAIWTGSNIEVIENGYTFASWDNNGGANKLSYNGQLGENNTVSFQFTPSTTGNGAMGGESNFAFTIETSTQKIRMVLKPYWCAAYIELNGSNLFAENYDPNTNLYSQQNAWFDVTFVFASGYTELVLDYLGDGENVFTKKIEDISFVLTEDAQIYMTCWGGNSGVKNIVFSKTDVKVEEPVTSLWTGTNVSVTDENYSFTSWDANGSANRLNYTGELGENNTVSFKYAPSTTGNGGHNEPKFKFVVQTATQEIYVLFNHTWKATYIYLDGNKLFGENYSSADGLFNQTNGWIDVKFVFANGYAELVVDYLGDGVDVFTKKVENINFKLEDVTAIYVTSIGANAGIKDIVFSKTEIISEEEPPVEPEPVVELWSGTNVTGVDGSYSFNSWDNGGGVNKMTYSGQLGDNNTVSFKYAPSVTGNGYTGEANITFNIQTATQRIRVIVKNTFKAAYVELDGTKLIAENYVADSGLFNTTDGWIDIKFVFADGYTELVVDYLGDGIDVMTQRVEEINFTLADVSEIYITSWGANAGIKDIVFSKTE